MPAASVGLLDPIERVLAVAEQRGLGYWEATDLDVSQADADLLRSEAPPEITELRLPEPPDTVQVRGNRAWIAKQGGGWTYVVDLDTGSIGELPVNVRSAVETPDGLGVGMVRSPDGFVAVVLDENCQPLPLPDPTWPLSRIVQIGDEVYGWPARVKHFPLLRLDGQQWVAARRFFVRALAQGRRPAEVTTDKASVYPRILDELLPEACQVDAARENNRIEADHGRWKARPRPMRRLKRLRSVQTISSGHALVQRERDGRASDCD
ncbi:hypothetical protein FrEUN1fDRAFT_1063 [Parafrankia sp. EUN1f]|nr:hypothetical protein FrEUN1fDRAFT_1063 [Parafrankia sp. EUN1f]